MSTAEVERSSPATPSSHQHLLIDDIELTGFRQRPASRAYSRTPIIVVDEDNSEMQRHSRPPAATRNVADDNSVTVIEGTGVGGSTASQRTRNGAQNRPIIILDSDEEQPSGSANSSHRNRRTENSSFRIFSPPPPPPQYHPVPPVPALPPLIAEPLPFAVLPPPSRPNQGRPRLPFDDPPQSVNNHNTGNVGGSGIQLGGGLLSQGNNSRRLGPRTQVHFQAPNLDVYDEFSHNENNTSLGSPSAIFSRFFASYFSRNAFMTSQSGQNPSRGRPRMNPGSIHHLHQALDLAEFAGEPGHPPGAGFFGFSSFGALGPWGRRDAALGLGPDYDTSLTHPIRPGPGWTHDFGIEQEDDDASKAKVEGSEILVCAKCLDPLLANADGMVDVGEKERKGRRVWGLRCGHVLDGKCVDSLMVPERERELADEENGRDVEDIDPPENIRTGKRRRKGAKEKVDLGNNSENEVKGLVATLDVKGKGKAPAAPVNDPAPQSSDDGEKMSLPLPSSEPANNSSSLDTSMLSRLRPRRNAAAPSPSLTTRTSSCSIRPRRTPHQPATTDPVTRGGLSTRRRGTKRKRATSPAAKAEIVENQYEWTCPVSGCGRVHVSIKIGGRWKMNPERGAVGIYV